ncbi:GcrA family cell cycle regulator [Salinarimonas soli]|uniref:GcrA cell cycle regulator n=1 Tax=Salinarimonas soli TaxID=1638099 RepID=A0A5B2VC15_9HYPH|nr:GcrA family cell cycle regulator [Salinarimonas soli]KAA2236661.1 GcrA cell cycle regulator [Salinarimonas soli]
MTDASVGWTDERVEVLKKLWSDGLSASQIAAEIGGVTRNAVIGKVHRLGLSGRSKSAPVAAAAPRPRKPSAPRPAGPVAEEDEDEIILRPEPIAPAVEAAAAPVYMDNRVVEIALPLSQRVTIMDLRESMCRWPIGDPTNPEFRFCGGRSITGLPYCPEHAQVAYQPAADRRRDRKLMRA